MVHNYVYTQGKSREYTLCVPCLLMDIAGSPLQGTLTIQSHTHTEGQFTQEKPTETQGKHENVLLCGDNAIQQLQRFKSQRQKMIFGLVSKHLLEKLTLFVSTDMFLITVNPSVISQGCSSHCIFKDRYKNKST